jgi:hypothetical protein
MAKRLTIHRPEAARVVQTDEGLALEITCSGRVARFDLEAIRRREIELHCACGRFRRSLTEGTIDLDAILDGYAARKAAAGLGAKGRLFDAAFEVEVIFHDLVDENHGA